MYYYCWLRVYAEDPIHHSRCRGRGPSGEDEGSGGDDSLWRVEMRKRVVEGGGSEEGEESDGESDELDEESGDELEDVIKVRTNLYSNSQKENT